MRTFAVYVMQTFSSRPSICLLMPTIVTWRTRAHTPPPPRVHVHMAASRKLKQKTTAEKSISARHFCSSESEARQCGDDGGGNIGARNLLFVAHVARRPPPAVADCNAKRRRQLCSEPEAKDWACGRLLVKRQHCEQARKNNSNNDKNINKNPTLWLQ